MKFLDVEFVMKFYMNLLLLKVVFIYFVKNVLKIIIGNLRRNVLFAKEKR